MESPESPDASLTQVSGIGCPGAMDHGKDSTICHFSFKKCCPSCALTSFSPQVPPTATTFSDEGTRIPMASVIAGTLRARAIAIGMQQ